MHPSLKFTQTLRISMDLQTDIFREYDIRGVVSTQLAPEVVFNIGAHLGNLMQDKRVGVGYDARTHAQELFTHLRNGLAYSGVEVFDLGMIPTPVAYFATFESIEGVRVVNSIMITGSHNPSEYNGFKITLDQKPFYGQAIQELAKSIANNPLPYQASDLTSKKLNAIGFYQHYLATAFSHLQNFPYTLGLDFGNGVGGLGLEPILCGLGIKFESLYANPDGHFPNHHPDPSEAKNLEDLKAHMQAKGLKIGLAFDGDADRIALLTPTHTYAGDELAILFAQDLHARGLKPFVIGEVKCSQVMYDSINSIGQALMYKTGHSNLKVKLKETNAHFAAEMSGHLFFNDRYFGYDDAIYAALRILELFLAHTPEQLEQRVRDLPYSYKTPEEKISVPETEKFKLVAQLQATLEKGNYPPNFPRVLEVINIDGVRAIFEHGFGLVRASNTTPTLVTRFEGKDEACAQSYKDALLGLLAHLRADIL